jgi:integrase
MVWTREQCGTFLDSVTGERFYALYHVAAYCGLRRSELAGLAWADADRFHDLRHGTATMLLAAGQPPKVISEVLGHATVAFTMDVYTEVAEELADAAMEALAAYIPRANLQAQ